MWGNMQPTTEVAMSDINIQDVSNGSYSKTNEAEASNQPEIHEKSVQEPNGINGRPLPPIKSMQNGTYRSNSISPDPTGNGTPGITNPAFSLGDGDSKVVINNGDEYSRDGGHDKEEKKQKPLKFCSFIANHHKLAFSLTLGGHLFFVVLSGILVAAGYDLFPTTFDDVPLFLEEDDTYLRALAWRYKDEAPGLLLANTSAERVGERTDNGDLIQVFFEADNVLTKERLEAIERVENEITSIQDWTRYCQQYDVNGTLECLRPNSLIRFFDGTWDGFNDTTYSNIPDTLYRASQVPRMNAILLALISNEAVITSTTAVSSVSRILVFTGLPLPGYDLSIDSKEDQLEDVIRDYLVDYMSDYLKDLHDNGVAGMSVYYSTIQLLFHDIIEQVTTDLMLAGGSLFFIFIFMLIQTRSLFITGLCIASVLTSFLGTNLIYRIVLDYKYFGIFHILSIFIILGIGADNIFVFNDTWLHTEHENYPTLAERLSVCYRRASRSMTNTSLTTFVAFISNAFSPLLGVNTFGIFSAILVMVNFFSAIIYVPCVVIMYHLHWEKWTWPCFRPIKSSKVFPCNKEDDQESEPRPGPAVRFFRGPFHRVITHRFGRWVFIFACVGFVSFMIYQATRVGIAEKPVDLFREGHNYNKAAKLNDDAFEGTLDPDRNVKVMIAFGLKNQDRGRCHKSDYDCHGDVVWDNSFDMNPKHAQVELLNFCKRLKTLNGSQYDILLLKRNVDDGTVDVTCFLEAMDDYLTADGKDATKYNPAVNLGLPTSELKYNGFFSQRTDLYPNISDNFYRYFETAKSYWLSNGYSTTPLAEYGTYSLDLGEEADPFDTDFIKSSSDERFGTHLRYAAIEIRLTLLVGTMAYDSGLDVYNAWENFVAEEVARLPPSLHSGIQFTPTLGVENAWHEFKRQEALSESAVQGIAIGICLAFVVLTLATLNIVISIMATVTITLVTVTVTGFIPLLGWKISVIESINLSLVVGLAVDYVVHLSESYHSSPEKDRVLKVKDMLGAMGVSVVSGAFTTLGSSAFMFAAQIQFFLQFGIFIFITIGSSIIYSLFLFTPMLSVMGPEGHTGSIFPLLRKLYYKIIGRKITDIKCPDCKGKGFREPDDKVPLSGARARDLPPN